MNKIVSGLLLLAVSFLSPAWAVDKQDLSAPAAVQGPQALKAVLLDVTRAGSRLVAVGERGVVLVSDDQGTSWNQVPTPVSATLLGVQFVNDREGWIVGHGGTVLHTEDSGQTWRMQLDGKQAAALELRAALASADDRRIAAAHELVADGSDKPLFAVSFSDDRNGMVVGAFGLAFVTKDSGNTWRSVMQALPNPRGLHLYSMARRGADVFIAGEQGLLLRSTDAGESFHAVPGPYEGSYFSLAFLSDGKLVLGGLKGNVFISDQAGENFQPILNPIPASVNAMRVTGTELLLVNQAGMLLRADEHALSLLPEMISQGVPLTAVTQASDGVLVVVGMMGVNRLRPSTTFKSAD